MAVTYGFYDSLNHDRLYNAQQMSAIFDGIINDGVFMSVGNQFHTVAGTGMQVIVKSGRAWFDSTWTLNDAEYPLSIDAADVLLTRIDAVVLEVNSEVATRANTIKVVKGTPASTPAKPTLTNTATIHQHALAYVTVAKNITAITNSMIEIVVGKTETPYVTAILQTTDITDLYNQWEDYFQTWFDTVRGTLDGDVALNLQNQITSLRRETLKNTTPPIIGLPASATPDDMFQALGNTGELHVWRKTVTTTQEVPGGYTLGDALNDVFLVQNKNSTSYVIAYVYLATSISANDDGVISADWGNRRTLSYDGEFVVNGPIYMKIDSVHANSTSDFDAGDIVFIPNGYSTRKMRGTSGYSIYFDRCQKVNPYPKTPARTTTTYPVSTNSNAYQEGEYGKAGYTLGDVKTGTFQIGQGATTIDTNRAIIKYGASISVTDTGTVSIASESEKIVTSDTSQTSVDGLKGKFFRFSQLPFSSSAFSVGKIYFFPANTVFTKQSSGNWYASKYQTVTSHGKTEPEYTIEYLGKLGDKARVQVVSYVGTGTYGMNNKNKLTFSGKPRFIMVPGTPFGYAYIPDGNFYYAMAGDYVTLEDLNCVWNDDTNTMTWYHPSYPYHQYNESGRKYTFVAMY